MTCLPDPRAQQARAYLLADATWATVIEVLAAHQVQAYAVGGVVRDALLGRASYDLDLAIAGSASNAARLLADALGGAVFVMDAERDVARVLYGRTISQRQIDLAGLRADDIAADLRARDFTVNALALAVSPWGHALLDPTGGLDDLSHGLLRQTHPGALCDDPVRVLRLVRLQQLLGFAVAEETASAAGASSVLLAQVAPERIRDEVLNMLALDQAALAWGYADELGLLPHVCGQQPPTLAWEQALQSLARLTRWQKPAEGGIAEPALEPFEADLVAHWAVSFTDGRPIGRLARLALLVGSCAADEAARQAWLRRLRLSARETAHVRRILAARESLRRGLVIDALNLHRYFCSYGAAGVDGAVLWLAEVAVGDDACPAVSVLDAWFRQHERIAAPLPLLSGSELLQALQLTPGPLIGELLTAIREAQVTGQVSSPSEALRLAASMAAARGVALPPAAAKGE